MADPVSILGGIDAAFSLANALRKYIESAHGAKHDLLSLIDSLEMAFGHEKSLEDLIARNERDPRWNEYGLACAKKCVEDSHFILRKLYNLFLKSGVSIDPNDVQASIDPSLKDRLWWPFIRPELVELKDELIQLKLNIQMAYLTWTSSSGGTPVQARETDEQLARLHTQKLKLIKRLQKTKTAQIQPTTYIDDSGEESEANSNQNRRQHGQIQADWSRPEQEEILRELEENMSQTFEAQQKQKEREIEKARAERKRIENEFWNAKKVEYQHRQQMRQEHRAQVASRLENQGIPEDQREQLIDSIVDSLDPTLEDAEMVDQPVQPVPKPALESFAHENQDIEVPKTPKARFSLFKSKRNAADASSSTSPESTFPPALLDRHSPTGFAELRACHFDPDPLGLYHSIFFEASMTWIADLYKKLEKRAENVAKSITPLPEFCKSAINNQLAALKRSTKDQSWVILLIYRVPLHGKRRFLGLKKPTKAGQNTYGAYVVFMRKTRPEPSRANTQSGLSKPSDGTTYVNNGTDAGSNSDGGDARHSSTPPAPRPPPEDGDGAPWESPSNRKPAHQSQSRSRTHQRETDAVEFIERDRRPPPSYDRRGKEDGRLEREEIITTTRHYAHEPQDEYHSPPSAIIRDIGERDRSKFTSHYPPSSWKSSELERSDSRSDRIRSRSRARHGGHSDYFHMPDVAIREDRRSRPDGSFDRLERERLDLEKKYYNSGTNRNSRWARANSNIYDPYDYAPRSPVRAHWLDEDYGYDYGSSPIQSRKKHVYYDDDDEVYRPQSRVHRHRGNSTSTGAASGHRPTQERERIDIDIRSDEGERELPWSSSYDMEDDFRVVEDDRRPSRRQREDDPFEEEIIIRHRDTDSSDGTRGRSRGERSWHGSELSRDHYSNTPIDPNSWALVRTRPASKMSSYIERKATSGPPRTIRIQSPAKDKTRSNKSGTEDNIDVNIGTLIRRQRTGRPGKTENNEQRPFFTAETSQKNDASKPADSTPRPSITAEPESIPEPSPSPHNKSRDSYFQDDITPEDSISRRGSTPVVSSGDNNLVKEPEPKR